MEFFMETLEDFVKSSLCDLLDAIQKVRPAISQHGAVIPYGDLPVHFEIEVVQGAEHRNLVNGGSCGLFGLVLESKKEEGGVSSNQQTLHLSFDLPIKLTPAGRGFASIGKPRNLRVC